MYISKDQRRVDKSLISCKDKTVYSLYQKINLL